MKKQIFPKEILDNTYEVHQFKHSKRSKRIYVFILLLICGILSSLPFIKVDLYTSVRGIIKTQEERIPLRITQSGQVVYTQLVPHRTVAKGDTLLKLAHPILDEKKDLLLAKLKEHLFLIQDLQHLTENPEPGIPQLQTSNYKKQWAFFLQGQEELETKLHQATTDYHRDKALLEKEVIAPVAFEKTDLAYDLAQNALNQFQKRYQAQWENELHQYTHQQIEMQSNLLQLEQNQSQFVLTASTTGTLLVSEGIPPGTWVNAGQLLGELSPEGELIVEAYVPSHKIGELFPDAKARFQVDAYNYHQWGMAMGSLQTIGKDVELLNNQPVFKVQCSLDQAQLNLANGASGKLQKGLTLTALFFQNKRSLFDLLFDDVNDWINPNQPKKPAP